MQIRPPGPERAFEEAIRRYCRLRHDTTGLELAAFTREQASDMGEIMRMLREAADQGHAVAQFALGLMHSEGRSVKQDLAEGFEWQLKSALQDFVSAQMSVAQLFFDGRGVQRSDVEAVRWYRKAAEQGT